MISNRINTIGGIQNIHLSYKKNVERAFDVTMLCTRMRLTERRFRIKSSISYQNIDGDYESRAAVSSEVRSPFVRPCAIIKMYESCNGNGKEVIKSSRPSTALNMELNTDRQLDETERTNQTDVHGSQSSLDR